MRANDIATTALREAVPRPVGSSPDAPPATPPGVDWSTWAAAWTVHAVEHGLDADPDGLRALAAAGVEHGAPAVVATVACDPSEPYVARLRAVGRLAGALERP